MCDRSVITGEHRLMTGARRSPVAGSTSERTLVADADADTHAGARARYAARAMAEPDPLLPFSARARADATLRPSAAMVALVAGAVVAGAVGGVMLSTGVPAYRALRAVFFGSALAYLVLSLLDFWEHFRLEKAATGSWWS